MLPLAQLDTAARALAQTHFGSDSRLKETTPTLCLLATAGKEADWNDRMKSSGHLAIPLFDRAFVENIPMVAKLLSDIDANLAGLDSGVSIASRKLLGGTNGMFYVPDAQSMVDPEGRAVISSRQFVSRYNVQTVFGMGGSYTDGTIVAAIIFTNESLDRLVVDRFPSLIGSFKIATAPAIRAGHIFGARQAN